MRKKSFEEMLENYLLDTNASNKDTEPDFKKLKCYYFEDSHYKKTHDKPSLEKIAKFCYPCHCVHLRSIDDV